MNLFAPARFYDSAEPEYTDRNDSDPMLLLDEMKTLQLLNGKSGGHSQAVKGVEEIVGANPPPVLRILDLGTGGADVPRTVVTWARKKGIRIEITAVDRNPLILRFAREWSEGFPEIHFERQDLLHLPYEPGSFDIVMSSLVFHHLEPYEAVRVLTKMQALARLGYLVNDLRRNWVSLMLVELVARRYVRNPSTRHDAIASSRAAFTIDELHEFAVRAGLQNYQIKRHNAVFRMSLVGRN